MYGFSTQENRLTNISLQESYSQSGSSLLPLIIPLAVNLCEFSTSIQPTGSTPIYSIDIICVDPDWSSVQILSPTDKSFNSNKFPSLDSL